MKFCLFPVCFILAGLSSPSLWAAAAPAPLVISEFLAKNIRSWTDEDGDHSDWIEIQNNSAVTVSLAGWHLTDDPAQLAQWTFPVMNVPPFGFQIVFASGKDRHVSGRELHTNFQLNEAGEYLALVAPDGFTVASEFAPTFPPQMEDVGYGRSREVLPQTLVGRGAPARVLIPADDHLGLVWTGASAQEPYDDSAGAGWLPASASIGYDIPGQVDSLRPLSYWNFNNNDPARILEVSGRNHHGTIAGVAEYTADAGGRSGQPGDRAWRLGGAGRAQITDASLGVYDSATTNNALTVSFWINGGSNQPVGASVFWFQENADGSGSRAAQAHVPWSDSTIYWDTSNNSDCCNGSARMFKVEPDPTKWKGRWNHYVLVKSGARKEIWQNGKLFHAAINGYPLTTLRHFTLGSGPNGIYGYVGLIDDFALWDVALGSDQIALLAAGASPMAITSLSPFFNTDLGAAMHNVNASAYVRIPFQVSMPINFDSLLLKVRYDDGFVAYLNGVEVARRNAPAAPSFNSAATSDRLRSDAIQVENIDLLGAAALLRAGTNVLAFQGLNDTPASAEFLLAPELTALRLSPGRYLPEATPGSPNGIGVIGFVADTSFSVKRGFFSGPFDVLVTCPTPGATLVYTTNGSIPTLLNGTAVTGNGLNPPAASVRITRTTVLRAAAFKSDHHPTDVDTQTYLFAADLARQPATIPGLPTGDYGVDPDVVNTTRPGYSFADALRSIPALSLVTEPEDMFGPTRGIYINSEQRGDGWERSASVEFFSADGTNDYHVNCGVRIHGNISRQNSFTPKHSFGLFFRGSYGAASFDYPLFAGSDVDRFDRLVLKGLSTDSWPCVEWGPTSEGYLRWQRPQASYVRDQWIRDTQIAMGQVSANGRFVHLFLNGLYFGLYNLTEHPDAAFQAAHYGGDESEYDALKDFAELDSGTAIAWSQAIVLANGGLITDVAYQRIQGNNANGTRNPAYPVLLDVDNLIDYMILHILAGGDDWPYHNWWAGRRQGPLSGGFRFFAWDQEISNNSLVKMQNAVGVRYELVNDGNTPANFYAACRANASFRVRFGDRVQKHLFNGGPLTMEANDARWRVRSSEIDRAVVAESARWGDAQRSTPYKREVEWLAHETWMHTNYWPRINAVALQRFRNVGLYPNSGAPNLSQFGGPIGAGFQLALSHTNVTGVIYYTLDGSDPRLANGNVAPTALAYSLPIVLNATTVFRARVKTGLDWSALVETVFHAAQDLRALRVTEILFHPRNAGATDGDEFEFLELKNTGAVPLELSGLAFTAGINFNFTNGTRIDSGQFLVLVRNPVLFATRYPGVPFQGIYAGKLDNSGETLRLTHELGGTVLSLTYDDQLPWPLAAAHAGFSLVPRYPTADGDPDDPAFWRASRFPGGSPGADDPLEPWPGVVINEVLTHTIPPAFDAIELFNPTAAAADVSGWFLTDDPAQPNKFKIPASTVLTAGGYFTVDERQFNPNPGASENFSLTATGEGVYLFSGDGTNVTGYSHGLVFGAADPAVSFGRFVNSAGQEQFPAQRSATLGTANAGPRVGPIVITEIHYHPEPGADEFIELQNVSEQAAPLFHADPSAGPWRINGLGYTLPTGVTLEAGQYLIVSSVDPALFRARYNVPAAVPVMGPFQGLLQDSGERLELQRPELFGTNGVAFVTVDAIRYNDKAPWPPAADGSGTSLQRLVTNAYGDDPTNWVAAIPSPGRPFPGGTPPEILGQPADTNVAVSGEVVLTVTAVGAGPLGYQWRLDGTPILSATNATLALTNVQAAQAGSYSVAVYNAAGAAISAPAYVAVLMPPSITQQPHPQTVQPGGTAFFNVTAAGTSPIRFQWMLNGQPILDATNSLLALNSAQPVDDGWYSVVVANAAGTITSEAVRLAVVVAPIILQSPWSQSVVQGGSVTLHVSVSNTVTLPLGYRWRRGSLPVAFLVLNERSSSLVLTNVQTSAAYNVLITNLARPNGVLSETATITVLADGDQDGLPDSWELAHGFNASNAADRGLDADGDSLTNWEEYLAGTNPTNALSYLKIDRSATVGVDVALEFIAVSNRSYTLFSRDLAEAGPWRTNASFRAAPTNRTVTLVDPGSGGTRFYRLATPGP